MNRQQLTDLIESHYQQIKTINDTKGTDYAGNEDALNNFKINAATWDITPYQAWGCFAGKHWNAISSFVKNNGQVESEPIESRLHDLILYSFLLLALIEEKQQEQKRLLGEQTVAA